VQQVVINRHMSSIDMDEVIRKNQEKAAKTGFDWPDVQGVWDKFHEEWEEFRQALGEGDSVHAEEEAGDVLFVFANLCRHYHIEPECALHRANCKFRRRFAHVEDRVRQSGRPWDAFSLDELDSFWQEAKQIERQKENTDS
ncbi:MazG nucleotide pyrophosphohydrolase domain-containing protein, partial [Megasphaera sp.]|uniref:MazG nucleotide pyrophosphohydrolase domain-containing protein n=1 Tax=Megasphaera sp. TaxID=2023260 RepID=UPI0025BD2BC2